MRLRDGDHRDGGMVTVEVALALPVLVLVSVCCLWFVDVVRLQAMAQDAARVVARELSRGVSTPQAEQQGLRVLPQGQFNIERSQRLVSVEVLFERAWLAPIGGRWTQQISAVAVGHVESELVAP